MHERLIRWATTALAIGILSVPAVGLTGCDDDSGDTVIASARFVGTAEEGTGVGSTANMVGADVELWFLGADGDRTVLLDTDVTGSSGEFTVEAANVPPSTRLLIVVDDGTDVVVALGTRSNLTVDPVTTGVADAVDLIVRTPEKRIVDDYTNSEIGNLTGAARNALQAAGTDLSDRDAVLAQVVQDVGGRVADFSEGQIVAGSINPVSTNPPDTSTGTISSFSHDKFDGEGQVWDITSDGNMSDGSHDAYDTFFTLSVNGTTYPAQTSADEQDDRALVFGPEANLGGTGLDVTRKVYIHDGSISQGLSFARFTEILDNPTGSDITVDVLVDGNLGSDESNDNVAASSDGNTTADNGDIWLTNHQDLSDPAVGFLFPGADTVVKSGDDIDYTWTNVTVPAGGRITIIHWGFQHSGGDANASLITSFLDGIDSPSAVSPAFFEDLSQQEVADATETYTGHVRGGAGAVASNASVTVENVPSGQTLTPTAASDGSFLVEFDPAPSSGDQIEVTASDGTNQTLVFP